VPAAEAPDAARRVLEVARALALELHPQRKSRLRVSLDASLDRDLGLDSLGRVELLLRLERAFRVRLPEALLAEASTVRDLVQAVLSASPARARASGAVADLSLGPVAATPDDAHTFVDALEWHAREHPERTHLVLEGAAAEDLPISYAALRSGARAVAAGLRARGIRPGDSVSIMLPTGREFFEAFFGALYAGAVPVPIYPPFRPAQLEEHLRRQAGILANAQARLLVAPAEARAVAALLRAQVPGLDAESPAALAASGDDAAPAHPARGADRALIQYTSGSTGRPKGVALSHANLLANVRAMGRALEVDARDVFVSWLPLYHDMGLIGAWLGSLYFAVPAAIFSPLRFLARPESWLWAIHRRRATLSAAPNFAYELCLRKLDDADLEGLDLSSWRVAANGAEPVSPETLRRFGERFERYGFRRQALMPLYGLAECSVGLAFPPPGRGPWIDRVERAALTGRGEARSARADDATALEFPSCGRPLPGHQIRIVDETGREVGERRQGRLQFRGPSATSGYFRNEEQTKRLFDGAWLESGDLGYVASGEVFLTGRTKDLIIRAGRNVYPHELEEAVGDLPGVRKGCVAVFGSFDARAQTEKVIVLAETREMEPAARDALATRIEQVTTLLLEGPPDDVVLAPPHTVRKTSSGKIRRAACRELYEQGRLAERPRALWWQALRLAFSGAGERVRATRRVGAEVAYAAWWWGALVLLGVVVWPLTLAAPRRAWAWALLRAAARAFFRLTGTSHRMSGLEQLPREGGAVLVSNHASYLDGLALAAALRRPVRFVAKRELADQLVAGPFLRRIGALFVERADLERGVADARVALDAARAEEPVVFFPEGTLRRAPGLLPFHLGAFSVAAGAGVPVIPLALRGTRSILRGDQWFPRRGAIALEVGPYLAPKSSDWSAAVELRDAARVWLLAHCGEPDLEEDAALAS
jgi:acyl carrier protein